jgi:hypothetical protein
LDFIGLSVLVEFVSPYFRRQAKSFLPFSVVSFAFSGKDALPKKTTPQPLQAGA